jgi:hypothetical protein
MQPGWEDEAPLFSRPDVLSGTNERLLIVARDAICHVPAGETACKQVEPAESG